MAREDGLYSPSSREACCRPSASAMISCVKELETVYTRVTNWKLKNGYVGGCSVVGLGAQSSVECTAMLDRRIVELRYRRVVAVLERVV